jgi:hypothetical protein
LTNLVAGLVAMVQQASRGLWPIDTAAGLAAIIVAKPRRRLFLGLLPVDLAAGLAVIFFVRLHRRGFGNP